MSPSLLSNSSERKSKISRYDVPKSANLSPSKDEKEKDNDNVISLSLLSKVDDKFLSPFKVAWKRKFLRNTDAVIPKKKLFFDQNKTAEHLQQKQLSLHQNPTADSLKKKKLKNSYDV